MHRTFVVSSLQFCPTSTNDPSKVVDDLGFSVVQLMSVSGHDTATGVRADLKIQDSSALEVLASYHTHRARLEWTFQFGGGAHSITVPLRWTKFHQPSGTVQVVRNVVMRDLIAEAEQKEDPVSQQRVPTPKQATAAPKKRLPAKTSTDPSPPASPSMLDSLDAERLWPSVLGGKVMVRPRYQDGSDDPIADLRRQAD